MQLKHEYLQNLHHQRTQQLGKTISTTEDLTYFAKNLMNERNFVDHLDTILIPRTVGSEGSRKVRNVSFFSFKIIAVSPLMKLMNFVPVRVESGSRNFQEFLGIEDK